jgi:hypothetical protein
MRVLQGTSIPDITTSYMAWQHGNFHYHLFLGKRRMAEGGKESVRVDEKFVACSEVKAL